MTDQHKPEEHTQRPGGERILIVDDDQGVQLALERLLSRAGYDVGKVESGEEAIAQLRQDGQPPPALLIVDYWMSGVRGADVLRAAAQAHPGLPAIALTGSREPLELAECVNTGLAARVLLKPWDDAGLLSIAAELIDTQRVRRDHQQLIAQVQQQRRELEDLRTQLAGQPPTPDSLTPAETIQDLIALLAFMMDSRSKSSGQSKRVAQLSSSLAAARGLPAEDVRQVEAAALLKDIAQIAAPELAADGTGTGVATELQPLIAGEILKRISGFEEIAEMVRQLQSSTGSGEDLRQLPLGSQILALSESFDREMYPEGSPTAARPSSAVRALEEMAGGQLSQELVQLFRQQVLPAYAQSAAAELEIAAYDLEPGMVLARDVLNVQGVTLLSAGTTLDRETIRHLRDNDGFSPLLSRILIKTSSISVAPGEEDVLTAFTAAASAPAVTPPAHPGRPAPVHPRRRADQSKPTVVVIDDDASVLAALRRELSSAGYMVIGFTGPEQGLEYVSQGGEALAVISDYQMPGMLGSTLLHKIQQVRPDLPCIVITAYATHDTVTRLVTSAQMVRLLKKPWDKDELLQTLEAFKQQRPPGG